MGCVNSVGPHTNVLIVGLLGSFKDLSYRQAKFLKCTKFKKQILKIYQFETFFCRYIHLPPKLLQ
jgi:hypothetical protein